MRIILLVLAVLGPFQAPVDAHMSDQAVVKIRSADPVISQDRQGSGLLFSYLGSVYVLTSDHVIFRGGDPYKHFATSAQWGRRSLSYGFADWGRGIAVLKMESNVSDILASGMIPDFQELTGEEDEHDMPVQLYGYPANSDTLVSLNQGLASTPLFIYGMVCSLRFMSYIVQSHAEFGMSGGPTFLENGSFLGTLSHLYLPHDSGEPTDVSGNTPWDDATILLVPFSLIKDSIADYLKTQVHSDWEYYQPERAVNPGQLIIQTGRMEFNVQKDVSQDIVNSVQIKLLPIAATPNIPHFVTGISYFRDIQDALIKQGKVSGAVVGLHEEKQFRYMKLVDAQYVNFHQFAASVYWANVHMIFQFAEPSAADLGSHLTSWLRQTNRLLDSRITDDEKTVLQNLKESLTSSQSDPTSAAWTVLAPGTVDDVISDHTLSPDTLTFLKESASWTSKYLQ